eukprot:TRINITY_DN32776_c0_g1_i1.p1 TRINITY_DN32776_c0_g1~~TRINITY_DN32776_c0_g1_i1.p1  ORF type:complete len:356 (+),score=151.95 TRINITY_DN32776_c0_g1_i1:66-1133(+)
MPVKRALSAVGQAVRGTASAAKKRKVDAPAVSPKRGQAAEAQEPEGWLPLFKKIEQLRKQNPTAPVDTIGCTMLGEKGGDVEVYRYQTLIALMLSSQTKDEQTAAAMERLKKHGLTLEKIAKTTEKKVGELIYGVGFYNNKAKFIKNATAMILKEFEGKTPDNAKDAMKLPGVGPKMAYLYLQSAHGKTDGIGVDVHVHRLANRYGWVDTKQAEQTRVHLEQWLPRAYWSAINHVLVGWGQTVCTPLRPKCGDCGAKQLCSYYKEKDGSLDMEDIGGAAKGKAAKKPAAKKAAPKKASSKKAALKKADSSSDESDSSDSSDSSGESAPKKTAAKKAAPKAAPKKPTAKKASAKKK